VRTLTIVMLGIVWYLSGVIPIFVVWPKMRDMSVGDLLMGTMVGPVFGPLFAIILILEYYKVTFDCIVIPKGWKR